MHVPKGYPEFNEAAINRIRARVIASCLITAVEDGVRKPPVRHLWFPEPRLTKRELRDGNPPADVDRPPWLKGVYLVVDVGEIPQDVWDEIKAQRREARKGTSEPTRIVDVVDDPALIDAIERHCRRGVLH